MKQDAIQKLIPKVLTALLLLHLACCIFIKWFPSKKLFYSRGLTDFYNNYVLPGPFFKEDLIHSSAHFRIACHTPEGWTSWRDPESENFMAYHQHPWKYALLKTSVFERHIIRSLAIQLNISKGIPDPASREFQEMHRYLADHYFPPHTDSISLAYTLSHFKYARHSVTDTLFHFKYKNY